MKSWITKSTAFFFALFIVVAGGLTMNVSAKENVPKDIAAVAATNETYEFSEEETKAQDELDTWHFFITDQLLSSSTTCESGHTSWGSYSLGYIPLGTPMVIVYDNLSTTTTESLEIYYELPTGAYYTSDPYIIDPDYVYYGRRSLTLKTTAKTGRCYGYLSAGNITRSIAWYAIDTPVSITSSPVSQTVNSGDNVTFSVSAKGTNLEYQWYYNTTNSTSGGYEIAGATSRNYTISNVPSSFNGRYYYCKVKNHSNTSQYAYVTKTSSAAKLTVNKFVRRMSVDAHSYYGEYDGNKHSIPITVTGPRDYTIYYSTSTYLNDTNYRTAGTTTKPTRKNVGNTTVYFYIHDNTGDYYDFKDYWWINIDKGYNAVLAPDSIKKTYSTSKKTFNIGAEPTFGTKLTYQSNSSKVTVSSSGVVTIPAKFMGEVNITITSTGTSNYYAQSKVVKLTVKPTKTTLSSVKGGSGYVQATWKKNASADGYQLYVAKNSSFSNPKKATITSPSTVTVKATGAPKGTNYVKVRAYKKVGSKQIYGAWSSVLSCKVK